MRKPVLLFATLATTLALSSVSARADLDTDLVAYWPFDNTLSDNSTGLSGGVGGHDGTMMGTNSTPDYQPGIAGTGIDLDGADQFVQIGGDEADFDFVDQAFSISAWFRVDALTKDWQALIAKGEGNRWRVHRRGGEDELTWNGGNADVPNHDTPINDGQFHHFVGVSVPGVGVQMWQDGVMVVEGPAPTVENNSMPVMIGENPDARNRTWDGVIDEVSIWRDALTADDIARLYQGGVGGDDLPTIINPCASPEVADVNCDLSVDMADYEIIRMNMGEVGLGRGGGDINRNGRVDVGDHALWYTSFNGPAAVPEPASAAILAIGLALLGCHRRRLGG